MNIDLDTVRYPSKFKDVSTGEGFLHSGNTYMKLEELIKVDTCLGGLNGSTKEIGGYNAVRLDNGRPGSFRQNTSVRPVDIMVVRTDHD